ncbi:MAG TPA: hypothetical protein VE954_05580 [Oligoflexus sp.]|uniref:hypothetical protein n=1 Tax=Oligoflexus sp. TaxID=1971216 RepID=UPI002D3BEDAD|nr:hypothetical protein [Oligoflexus sp.]HYX32564.1 hypothetical protein [Oligoflexus sp.]
MRNHAGWKLCLAIFMVSSAAHAADNNKSMNLTLPLIAFGGESVTKAEWNLRGHGSLGLELNMMGESEMYSDKEIEEKNGDSLMMKGSQVALLYSQYSKPKSLSGGYWTIGLGYRQVKGYWDQTPTANQDIQGASLNADGKVRHSLSGAGPTAQVRTGYRYVAESIPLSVGAYIGLRHFQSTMKDAEASGTVTTTAEDLTSLQRRMMSHLEPGIELGLAF